MRFFPDMQTFLEVGPIAIKWYAILILSGAYLAYYLSLRNLKKMGYSSSLTDDLFFGALISGVIGSRLWFVLFYDLNYYLSNPAEILMTWEGGLAIQGGLLAGALYAYFFTKKRKINFMRFADAIVPNVLIAQAIGRWGNFLNQEAFGRVVSESFYANWPRFIADHMYITGVYREPTFFYESTLNIIGFILIVLVYKRLSNPKRGDLVYAYLMWYGVTRFWIEGLRSDSLMFLGLRSAQLVSIVFLVLGLVGMLGFFRKVMKKEKPVILFDFDGTLMDTEKVILESYRRMFAKYLPNVEITREMEISFLGPTLWETFERYIPHEDSQRLVEEYRQINFNLHQEMVKPIDHAQELIKELKKQGYSLGIVSSKLSDAVVMALEMFDMKEDFDVIIGLDHVKKPKPDPEGILLACKQCNRGHDSVIYVGDTATDVKAAINAGVFSIAIVTSADRQTELIGANPNRLIRNLSEIETILQEDVEWTFNMM